MIALAVCIGLLVIFLTMYTTVIERTRDIGVLKSLGAVNCCIVRALLAETTLLCLSGNSCGNRLQLHGAGGLSEDISDTGHPDYAGMDRCGRLYSDDWGRYWERVIRRGLQAARMLWRR